MPLAVRLPVHYDGSRGGPAAVTARHQRGRAHRVHRPQHLRALAASLPSPHHTDGPRLILRPLDRGGITADGPGLGTWPPASSRRARASPSCPERPARASTQCRSGVPSRAATPLPRATSTPNPCASSVTSFGKSAYLSGHTNAAGVRTPAACAISVGPTTSGSERGSMSSFNGGGAARASTTLSLGDCCRVG